MPDEVGLTEEAEQTQDSAGDEGGSGGADPLADVLAPEPVIDLEEEASLGGTDAGRATNGALLALSRAARSFLLYDTKNEAIKAFLDVFHTKTFEALEKFGPMELEVRPFELTREGEVVYLERDRERSLAFRLYRDGVRRISIE